MWRSRQEVQLLRRHFAQHVAQIEVGFGDLAHLAAADVTEIALFAARHELHPRLAAARSRSARQRQALRASRLNGLAIVTRTSMRHGSSATPARRAVAAGSTARSLRRQLRHLAQQLQHLHPRRRASDFASSSVSRKLRGFGRISSSSSLSAGMPAIFLAAATASSSVPSSSTRPFSFACRPVQMRPPASFTSSSRVIFLPALLAALQRLVEELVVDVLHQRRHRLASRTR